MLGECLGALGGDGIAEVKGRAATEPFLPLGLGVQAPRGCLGLRCPCLPPSPP